MNISTTEFKVPVQKKFKFKDFPCHIKDLPLNEEEIKEQIIPDQTKLLRDLHLKLFAEEKKGIMVALQAMDAAGKDESISYIFSNLNAQGLKVTSFGKPSEEESKHDYMWRVHPGLPARGEISLLNRSHYEEVIVTRVHGLLEDKHKETLKNDKDVWEARYRQINNYEKYLYENGFIVIKFFFHMSKETQKERLLERMKNPKKNWEFSINDIKEREYWDQYHEVFEDMIDNTSTSYAPWYVLPADNAWYSRAILTKIMIEVLQKINPKFPTFSKKKQKEIDQYIKEIESE